MKGQIVKIVSNLCSVECEGQVFECTPRGKFRNQKISPVVGDFVEFEEENKYLLDIYHVRTIWNVHSLLISIRDF